MIKNAIKPDTTYRIRDWNTKELIAEYKNLNKAKKECREQGYYTSRLNGNVPVAYVECDTIGYDSVWSEEKNDYIIVEVIHTDTCIYNPRF